MAVLLVLASGTAVSLAVTDGEDSAVGSNAAAQETTEVGEETTDVGNQETTEVGDEVTTEADDDEGDAVEDSASVTINDQESDGERIVIEEVTMDEGGFIAIHDETLAEDAIGSVVGTSVYLEAGTHENVIITLGRPISETQTLVAMPHQDTNENQVYDFVISGGEADGAYTTEAGDAVVDDATVTVGEQEVETTTEEEDVVETTTEDVDDVETTEDTDVIETTTEIDDVVETTTEEEDVVETTTEEEDEVETTTEEEVVETTTEEEDEVIETTTEEVDDVETTTEEEVVETTTEVDDVEEPAEDEQQLIFKVEQMNIDRWSFVLGDEEEPDRTETVSDITVQDRRIEINLTEVLQEQSEMPSDQMTTQDPEEVQEQLEENLSGDIETVRFVIENVNVENVTFVITAPEDMELPETPDDVGPETTVEEDDEVETTTPEDEVITTTEEEEEVETTTEEEEVVETTTEEEEEVETTTEEEEVVETTTEEVDEVETTTEEDEVDEVETTTEEEVVETTTEEEEVVETTTEEEEAELESFNVSAFNAPESAEVGDTINVSAVVTNPNDVEATQEVAFRLEGTVVARENVTLNASGSTTVEFQVDTTDVPPGEYIHGIYTRDFGELAVVTLEDPTAEETDDAVETETEEDEEETELPDDEETELPETETELPDDDEETTVAFETTTEA